ncbi:MAG: hypothetical protein R3E44_00025 [Paracoccaceae bacterium]
MSRLSSTIRNLAQGWFTDLAPMPPQLKALAAAVRSEPDPRPSARRSAFAPRPR